MGLKALAVPEGNTLKQSWECSNILQQQCQKRILLNLGLTCIRGKAYRGSGQIINEIEDSQSCRVAEQRTKRREIESDDRRGNFHFQRAKAKGGFSFTRSHKNHNNRFIQFDFSNFSFIIQTEQTNNTVYKFFFLKKNQRKRTKLRPITDNSWVESND